MANASNHRDWKKPFFTWVAKQVIDGNHRFLIHTSIAGDGARRVSAITTGDRFIVELKNAYNEQEAAVTVNTFKRYITEFQAKISNITISE